MAKISEKRLTIKDIAAMAKVSAGTVDRVLHKRGEVSEKTRKKIDSIIKKHDFELDLLASTLASKKTYTIATLIPAPTSEIQYWEIPLKGIEKAYREIKHFGITIENCQFDYSNEKDFMLQSNKLISSKPDAVLLAPVLHQSSLKFITQCHAKNIPVVIIDTYIEKAPVLSYVGQNAFHTGMLAARLMHYGSNGKTEYLIVNISQRKDSYKQIHERASGFKKYFETNKIKNVITIDLNIESNSETSIAKGMDKILADNTTIKGIFVANSRVSKIADYLIKSKRNEMRLIGYDLTNENIKHLKKGTIDFLISQKPEVQAYNGIMSLFNYLIKKNEVEKIQYIPIDIITRENIDYYKF